ncbi:MAG: hypothetical protein ACRD0Z_06100 [Acidimicrobiales bacterium]
MGFLDKVKGKAEGIAQKAQDGVQAGQEKLAAMQAKKQGDALLLELGGIVYSQRQGRPGTPGDDRVAAIMGQLQQFEAEHGAVTITPAGGGGAPSGGFVPGGGGFVPEQRGGMAQGTPAPEGGSQSGGIPQSGGLEPNPGGGIPQSGGLDPNRGGGIPQSGGLDPAAGIPQGIPQSNPVDPETGDPAEG